MVNHEEFSSSFAGIELQPKLFANRREERRKPAAWLARPAVYLWRVLHLQVDVERSREAVRQTENYLRLGFRLRVWGSRTGPAQRGAQTTGSRVALMNRKYIRHPEGAQTGEHGVVSRHCAGNVNLPSASVMRFWKRSCQSGLSWSRTMVTLMVGAGFPIIIGDREVCADHGGLRPIGKNVLR